MSTRREFLYAIGAGTSLLLAPKHALAAPSCGAKTESNIEGPFFKKNAPNRITFDQNIGANISIVGQVVDTRCRPVPGATVEFWQADYKGTYDNNGFNMRGTQKTSATGHYFLHTIEPGRYLNGHQYRPAHIHVKISTNGRVRLTTQLYFPSDPYNGIDPFFKKSLLLNKVTNNVHGCSDPSSLPTKYSFQFVI